MSHIRADSLEYWTATLVADHDLTGKMIEVALPVTGEEPAEADWVEATVTSVTQTSPGRWTATYRVLVGPSGDFEPVAGLYDWLVRLTDSPEIPVRNAAMITVV